MTCLRRLPAITPFLVLTLVAIASCGKEPLGSNNPDGGSGGAASGGTSGGGSGGAHGTGGVVGSGGAPASGGSSGTGGKDAPVGADGAVDSPASADGSTDCNGLITEYEAALREAKKCDPTQEIVHCQVTVSPSLPCPGCPTHVEITTGLDAIRARWDKASCRGPSVTCPAIKCVDPGTGVCTASAGGGVCTNSPPPSGARSELERS